MELEDIYENVENNDIEDTTKPRTLNHSQDEGKDQKCRGSRCLVLMTVCLGIICVVLLVFIIAQHISNTAERESLFKSNKNTVQEFNQTINSLQDNYTELMTEKDQLKNNFNSLSQKKLELETELRKLYEQCKCRFNISSELKSWADSRKYCRDRGADLIIINTEEKQRFISSLVKEFVWIGLTDIENEGDMKWVDNSPLRQGFWEINEPNDAGGNEDCIELNPAKPVLNNWNDIPCSTMRKFVCEN
ncbi:CD209 antigen-like protein E [Megalobrama amblycephala]|uniref:CD209 antigen-like protein E n=1 Tax=Megalobrama amblycephala TaxID=75352 RepID=UPI00201458E5|nr:CD209 antigen-like protein E [Megalobrama amblycephala]